MKKSLIINYGLLILLTIATAIISNFTIISSLTVGIIMGLAVLKFGLVSFQFMELKKAHPFWKGSVILFLLLIVLVIVIMRINANV